MTPASPSPARTRRAMLCACTGLAALGMPWLAACDRTDRVDPGGLRPAEIAGDSACALDGMLLAEFPGPKGQIHYRGERTVHWCCDTLELLSALLAPEQIRKVAAAYVQDMGLADWERPRGHWIDARQATYVLGSKRVGAMGVTAVPFSAETAARAFVAQHGGRALRFAEIRPEQVDLSGGAQHDRRM